MPNLYTSFEQRLRAIANGHYEDATKAGKVNQSAILCINLLFSQSGQFVGWYKPQVIILEPGNLNPLLIAGCEKIEDWESVIEWLSNNKRDRSLLIRHGKPLVWLP